MTERRTWTPEQDQALKHLRSVLKVGKWSEISRRLEHEFHLPGRNGKQCRQRYINHLSDSIKFTQISVQEEQRIFQLHDLVGNKWSQICKDFQGRTQNQIKNHFHSKLRKAIRKLNNQIKLYFKKSIKPYKLNIVYKIVEASDFRFFSTIYSEQDLKFFNDLKNSLIEYARGVIPQGSDFQELIEKQKVHNLLSQLEKFENNLKHNKSLFTANRKNKKNSNRKVYSNDKISSSTVNLDISESEELESQEKESKESSQGTLIFLDMGFQFNQGHFKSRRCSKEFNESQTSELMVEEKQMKKAPQQNKEFKATGLKQNLKCQISGEKSKLVIPDSMRDIIEEQEIPEISVQAQFSFNSLEPLMEFQDNEENDSSVRFMLRMFDSFSNIESTLFE